MSSSPTQSSVQFLECRARVLAGGGALGVVDMLEMPAESMPPLHVHRDADEGFYVLEGELTVFQPAGEIALGEGEFFLAARGIPHTYRVGERDARCLIVTSPAGFDAFVHEVADLDAPSPDRVTAIAAEYGIEILGPPGMLPSELAARS